MYPSSIHPDPVTEQLTLHRLAKDDILCMHISILSVVDQYTVFMSHLSEIKFLNLNNSLEKIIIIIIKKNMANNLFEEKCRQLSPISVFISNFDKEMELNLQSSVMLSGLKIVMQ